jgi:phage replication-related protein YjqB (UPF0714/DUF867 family)
MADTYANWQELVTATNPDGSLVNVEGRDWAIINRPGPGGGLLHMAIHGGAIEPPPQQLADVCANGGPFYTFVGMKSSGNSTLHITSTHFDEPRARQSAARSLYTVSWHGHADQVSGYAVTYVGGLDTGMGGYIREHLEAAGFTVADPPAALAGVEPANICNSNQRGRGVQLEISRTQRGAFFVNGDLRRSQIENPANRTDAFYRYTDAVQAGIAAYLALSGGGTPPVGLPTAVPPPPPPVGVLGCAQEYSAVLHWRGGGQVYGTPAITDLTAVQWGRTYNDTSSAQVTIAKPGLAPDCCDALGRAEPWIHELTLYREGELVWQGPIIRARERRADFVIEALDVMAWMDKVVNTFRLTFTSRGPDADRRPGPVTKIAETVLRLNLVESGLSQFDPDWPRVMDYIVRRDTPNTITFARDGDEHRGIWAAYVGDVLRELVKRGLGYTTVGRSIVLCGDATLDSPALARLTVDDITGDVELVRDGTSAATSSWASNQRPDPNGAAFNGTRTEVVGSFTTVYGRLESLIHVEQNDDGDHVDEVVADLRAAATADMAGRYPAPIAIGIPDGSTLAATAPVQINQLIPGQRFDFVTEQFCTRIGQGFMLTDVQVQWTQDGEQVGISLVPLASPYGIPLPS